MEPRDTLGETPFFIACHDTSLPWRQLCTLPMLSLSGTLAGQAGDSAFHSSGALAHTATVYDPMHWAITPE